MVCTSCELNSFCEIKFLKGYFVIKSYKLKRRSDQYTLKKWKIAGFTKDEKEIEIDTRDEKCDENSIQYDFKKHEPFEQIRIINTDKSFDHEEILQFHYLDFFGRYSSKEFQHSLFVSP